MDEESFRCFYAKTARPLWAYLARVSRDPSLADDLTQESYLRLLRAALPESMAQAHRKSYLYQIATNLLRDHMRAHKFVVLDDQPSAERTAERIQAERDVGRLLDLLKPRERELLWLAYVECFSHQEIATLVGAKAASIRPLLFRARRKLAGLLRESGIR